VRLCDDAAFSEEECFLVGGGGMENETGRRIGREGDGCCSGGDDADCGRFLDGLLANIDSLITG